MKQLTLALQYKGTAPGSQADIDRLDLCITPSSSSNSLQISITYCGLIHKSISRSYLTFFFLNILHERLKTQQISALDYIDVLILFFLIVGIVITSKIFSFFYINTTDTLTK